MKHWQEMGDIVDGLLRLGPDGMATAQAVAIVTRIEGSAYRRPGAKLLIRSEANTVGGVSGGCLEEDVRQVGLAVLESGRSRTLHYDTGDDDSKIWGLGLGCDGKVDLVVLPAPGQAKKAWERVRGELAGDCAFAVATMAEDEGSGQVMVMGPSGRLEGTFGDARTDAQVDAIASEALHERRCCLAPVGARKVFVEVLLPPPKLLVCGAGDDARPLVDFASAIGFRVTVADHRSAYLTRARFPGAWRLISMRPERHRVGDDSAQLVLDQSTYAIIKTHSLSNDAAWLRRLLKTEVTYIGILGPRARIDKLRDECGARGDDRIFGPVGLDLGADGPEQVALSVTAEVLAVWSRRSPRHLREREAALHVSPR